MPDYTRIGSIHGWAGSGLTRPECVLAHQTGLLLVPNCSGTGGFSVVGPSGTHHVLAKHTRKPLHPNGIALESGGSVLLAHLGNDFCGGIFRLHPNGSVESVVSMADSKPLPPTNFVVQDSAGRLWITVSTRKSPRAEDYRHDAASGFIAVAEPGSNNARIVADGLGYTNECVIDEQRSCVYVNETFARRLTRYELDNSSTIRLTNPEVLCKFGEGTYPDGLALDTQGYLWITSIVSNRILRISPDGQQEILFEDSFRTHVSWTETAYMNNGLGREHLDTAQSTLVRNISNLAFAGPSLSRIYLGNLLGHSLPFIDTNFTGRTMPHWDAELGELEAFL